MANLLALRKHPKPVRWWHVLWALPLIGVLFVWGRQALIDRASAARQQTTVGTITGHEPSYHDRYFYTYAVSGQTFRHWQIPHRVTWHLGQKVVVYYDPQDHATSSLTNFSERSADATGPISLLLVLTVGLIGYILYEARHQARAMDRTRIPDDPERERSG